MKFTLRGIFVFFVRDWWRSREWPCLGHGLPALLAGLGLLILLAFAEMPSPWERSRHYLSAARRAHQGEQWQTAEIYYKKSLAEWPDDEEILLEAASVADRLENTTRRDAILRRLIEEEASPIAMLFQAAVSLRERQGDGAIQAAESLLERALVAVDGEARKGTAFLGHLDDLRRMLAGTYLNRGAFSAVIAHGNSLVTPRWEDGVDLATAHLLLGQRDEAARIAAPLFDAKTGSSADEVSLYGRNAIIHSLQGNDALALRELRLARPLVPGGEAMIEWGDRAVRCFHLLRLATGIPSMELLEQAVAVSHALPSVAEQVVILSGMGAMPGVEGMESGVLTRILAECRAPVSAHLVAGMVALREKRQKDAAMHFKIAEEFYPALGMVLTQCGIYVAHQGETYGSVAVKLGELGVRLMDEHMGPKLGHGRILLAQGRWQEAIDWLTPLGEAHEEVVGAMLKAAEAKLTVAEKGLGDGPKL